MKLQDANGNDITPIVITGGVLVIGFTLVMVYEYVKSNQNNSNVQTGAIQSYIMTLQSEVQALLNNPPSNTIVTPPPTPVATPAQQPIIINYPVGGPINTIYQNQNVNNTPTNNPIPNTTQDWSNNSYIQPGGYTSVIQNGEATIIPATSVNEQNSLFNMLGINVGSSNATPTTLSPTYFKPATITSETAPSNITYTSQTSGGLIDVNYPSLGPVPAWYNQATQGTPYNPSFGVSL